MERHVRSFLLPPMSERDAALLIRVSTKKQRSAGYSEEDQRTWGKAEAARLRLRLREYTEDESTSHSDSLDRIALNQLEEDIVAGRIGVLLLKHHDRLGRGSCPTTPAHLPGRAAGLVPSNRGPRRSAAAATLPRPVR